MKSLKESILSTNNANVKYLYSKDITWISTTATLQDIFNMQKMYDDAKKITGRKPKSHAEAVKELLFKEGKMSIPSRVYDKLLSPITKYEERNSLFSEVAKEKLEDYIMKDRYNFYFNKSPWSEGSYTIGILDHGRGLSSYDLIHIKP